MQLYELITNPSSRQRGRSTLRNPQLSIKKQKSGHVLQMGVLFSDAEQSAWNLRPLYATLPRKSEISQYNYYFIASSDLTSHSFKNDWILWRKNQNVI
jgi:hypothetical protein